MEMAVQGMRYVSIVFNISIVFMEKSCCIMMKYLNNDHECEDQGVCG